MKKVLLTGGNGFIGQHVAKHLRDSQYDVLMPTSKELNVSLPEDWERWKNKEIGHVIHLAGKTFVPDSWENPEVFFQTNIIGTLNAINFCRLQKINMTYISAYIYGVPQSNPIPENAPISPNNPYAKSKYMAEELCEFFCTYYDMDITVLRLFNVYGPGQKDRFLIPFIIQQVLDNGNSVTVQDLNPKRDYVYISDVCQAIELSVQKTMGYHLFNIGSGISYSVREIINKSQKIAGVQKEVVSRNNTRRNELNDVVADVRAIEAEWGWKPQITMDMGLFRCMEDVK